MTVFNCSEEPLKKLRFAVLQKHGKLYGVLKQEINTALLERAKKLSNGEMKS